MKRTFDISEFVGVKTEQAVIADIADRYVKRRKEFGLTQKELSLRSGVSYASIRRFETTGEISLSSLLSIAHAIKKLEDFDELFSAPIIKNLKDYKND